MHEFNAPLSDWLALRRDATKEYMEWSPQQAEALKKIKRWALDRSAPQVMRVFGYAGTGKTTMAKEIASAVSGEVLFMTFTGKAALVLRKKGCEGASTIHSAIYKPQEDPYTGHTEFIRNPDSAVARAALVIVDEVSMVGEDIGRDLLSYGTKVLVLGDPFQLPPIKGEGFFTSQTPDVMLTEIHRQAADNPIIRMSMEIRDGKRLTFGSYGDSLVAKRADIEKDDLRQMVLAADQLLCGRNATRQTFNRRVRELRGIAGAPEAWMPTVGDRLVCLKNSSMKGLLNGGLWSVEKVDVKRDKFAMRVASLDDPKSIIPVDVKTPFKFFQGLEKEMDWRERKHADEFCHGYALTVHKSQGSQWDNVLLFDESSVFRENSARHLYTGCTRAAERVTIVV